MGLNDTPLAERVHIAFFGRRNAGKSSLLNAVTSQNIAIVSDILGTTTDPVYKSMELLPLGPVTLIDTAGIDDDGFLGEERVKKTYQVLNKTDIAVLVVDAKAGMGDAENALLDKIKAKSIPYILVYNKCDLLESVPETSDAIYVSAKEGKGIFELKEKIATLNPQKIEIPLVSDFLEAGDFVLLIVPIDKSAPKGRLILPQQQTIRDILDKGAVAIACKENEIESTLKALNQKPKLAITDSQIFPIADKLVPKDIPLTSFSILMARFKGTLPQQVTGARPQCAGLSVREMTGCFFLKAITFLTKLK